MAKQAGADVGAAQWTFRSTAENHIEEYNESIVKEIVNGDLELSNRMIELKNVRNKHSIEMSVRDEILKRAEREKS